MADTTDMADAAGQEPAKPEPKVIVLRDYCQRCKGVECNRCELACPHDAIGFDENGRPVIDADACTQCGICYGICDAFSSTRITLLDLHARVRRIALRGETVYFTCKENIFPGFTPAANVIVLPCLACLPPEFWTLILAENIKVVVACDLSYCTDCERSGDFAESLYTHAIATAEEWTGKKVGFAKEIPEKENIVRDLASPDSVDRRNAFTNIIGDVGDIASGKRRLRNSDVLQQFFERRERSKAIAGLNLGSDETLNDFAPLGRTRKIMIPKRSMLLEAIERDPEIASRIPVYVADIDRNLCKNALECSEVCPTGALYPNPDNGIIELDVTYCIGCGLCIDACPHAAIDLLETTAVVFRTESEEEDE